MALSDPRDRFPLGLPGHRVPLVADPPSGPQRPWGMDQAVPPVRSMGKHDKPTGTRDVKQPTQYTDDSQVRSDEVTQTVTD